MVARKKIDSNETSAYYAEEYDLGVLPGEGTAPGVAVWKPLEPNEYDDFGGELTLLARNPINSSRQRKKGAITDLEASGGLNQDFTQTNLQDLLQGFMFADFRRKAEGTVTAVTATGYALTNSAAFPPNGIVMATGFAVQANNGAKFVTGIAGGEVTVAAPAVEPAPPFGARLVNVGIRGVAGDLSIETPANSWPELKSATLDFTDYGLIAGEWLFIGGDLGATAFAEETNNGFARIRSVSADTIVLDQSQTEFVADDGAGQTVHIYFGRVLKNELAGLIKRRSYQLERQLGAPDTAALNDLQAEYLKGAVPSEFVLNVATADKINADLAFVALDNEQRRSSVGIKAGVREPLVESDAFNTSSDYSAMRLSIVDPGNTNPVPLFGYMTEFTLTINNNLTVNKAIGVLGGFDVTAGTFEVSAEATAYFDRVEAVEAVRRNADVQMFKAIAKANAGWVLDIPLIALGNARLDVAQDEPIMLPLQMDAATAVKINPNTDYTLMWVFFDYLPTRAE